MGVIRFRDRLRVPDYSDTKQIRHGTILFDYEKCNACFLCRQACPASAITQEGDTPVFSAGVSECIYCGNCVAICPHGAITLDRAYCYSGRFKTIDHQETQPPRL